MGSKSGQTIGYRYRHLLFEIWAQNVDVLHRFIAGGKRAWAGCVHENQTIQINAPAIWGDDEDNGEGGMVGPMDVQFGLADQPINARMASILGERQTGNRGWFSTVFEGIFGSYIPNPKTRAVLLERIHAGWPGGVAWYPEKAAIPIEGSGATGEYGILVTGSAKADGIVWAAAPLSASPTFVGLDPGTGADMTQGIGAYSDGMWAVAAEDDARHSANGMASWLTGTLSTGSGGVRGFRGGTSGWLAFKESGANRGMYAFPPPETYAQVPTPDDSPDFWQSGFESAEMMAATGGRYYIGYQRVLYVADTPNGPFEELWRNTGEHGDPNGASIIAFGDMVQAPDGLYATVRWNFSGPSTRYQVRRSDNGGVSWPDENVLYQSEPGSTVARPAQLAYDAVNDEVIALCTDGSVITSADNWSTPTASGLSMPGDLFPGSAPMSQNGGKKIDCGGGFTYVIGASGGTDDKCVVSASSGTAFGAAITMPIQGARSIAVGEATPIACPLNSMNPAHIIRYMLTQKKQIPDAMLSEDSFTYAADVLFAEGFGLCEEFDPDQETPEAFILRICDIIGACCTQSKTDGLIYLDLLRNDYDKDTLPQLIDDDIVDWQEDQAVPAELTNSVQIGWRDVLVDGGLERITPPAKALGHIRTHGREMNQVIDMRGIPFEHIAMRVAEREKKARSLPLVRLSPTTFRRHAYLRPGMPLLINCPKRGRVDMVVRVGELDHGTPLDARLRWVLLQDVFDLPATVELDPTTIHDDDDPPVDGAGEVAIEAPYIELVATLPADRMAAVGEESGFLLTGVTAPTRGTNYAIYSKLASEALERRAFADFCPTAVTVGDVLPLDGGVQLTSGRLLERVEVGSWALWEDEIIRVDGIDDDLILTMGRACADTVPAVGTHAAGARIFFLGDWNGSDRREYATGDELAVKLPVRTGSDEQALVVKDELPVTFAQRQFRPYPPGNLVLNGEPFYASGAITTTPPGGGGGGGGPSTPPATGPSGGPASQELGPLGGFPDNAPPLYPLPTVFGTNIVDDPGMDDPATLARWRKRDGTALGPEWALVGGKLQLQASIGTHEAFDFGTRFSIPYMPFPRMQIDAAADVQNSPGCVTSIGAAWGTWQSSNLPQYPEVSDPANYPDETNVPHTWLNEIMNAGQGVGIVGEYLVMTVVPMVRHVVSGDLATATVDNVVMEITKIEPAVTAESPANLDLSAGMSGISLWPDPSGTNPDLPTISVVAGVMIADFHTAGFYYRWAIWDDPLALVDIDKFVRLRLKGWSNDAKVESNTSRKFYPFGGVAAGLAYKNPGGELVTVAPAGRVERGDFTPREYYQQVLLAMSSGYTVHAAALLVGSVGTQAKLKDYEIATTDDAYPESP